MLEWFGLGNKEIFEDGMGGSQKSFGFGRCTQWPQPLGHEEVDDLVKESTPTPKQFRFRNHSNLPRFT